MKMKATLKEARQIAVFLEQSCFIGSIVIGSLAFLGIGILVLSQPWLIFSASLVGGVFGWHMILALFGQFFLQDLEENVPGLGDATVQWFRHAQPGDFLDMRKLAAQVEARRQLGKR
ncbi:MAG: hypothetical protein V7606_23 [Burkholderiales bacterium]|jgi:hypothetical protein